MVLTMPESDDKDRDDFISRAEFCETLHQLAKKLMNFREHKQASLVLDIMFAFWPKPVPQPEPVIDFLNLPLRDPNATGPRCNRPAEGPVWYRYKVCTRAWGHDGPCAHPLLENHT